MSSARRGRLVIAVVVVAALLAGGAVAYVNVQRGNRASAFSPEVRHTGAAPTGYVVTFRYRDPTATSVLIQGEWYFSNPAVTTSTSSQGLLPAQWRRGDVATGWPAPSTPDGWPVTEMTKDPRTGVWSYSIPLPSGYYNYGFYVGCSIDEALSSPDQTVACADPEVADPSNPPWNDQQGVSTGSSDGRSEVYVPADPAFDNVNDSWEGPTSPKGKLADVNYTSLADVSAPGRLAMNYLAIYTPDGYEPHRSMPYPTLYLSPGAGLNEVDWSTQGDAANILDNLIKTHQIKPTVVVMTSTSCPGDCDPTTASPTDYDQDVLLDVIPYVQAHYDVSTEPSQRSFAGFSAGGRAAGSLLVDHANMFGSFGLFSPCPAAVNTPTPAQAAAIRLVRVMVGGGNQDPECHPVADDDVTAIQSAGVTPDTEFFYGGHDWDVWRILLKDFLTSVAFKPTGA
jgi:enterochelin esterase-like enzyme